MSVCPGICMGVVLLLEARGIGTPEAEITGGCGHLTGVSIARAVCISHRQTIFQSPTLQTFNLSPKAFRTQTQSHTCTYTPAFLSHNSHQVNQEWHPMCGLRGYPWLLHWNYIGTTSVSPSMVQSNVTLSTGELKLSDWQDGKCWRWEICYVLFVSCFYQHLITAQTLASVHTCIHIAPGLSLSLSHTPHTGSHIHSPHKHTHTNPMGSYTYREREREVYSLYEFIS